MKRLLPVIAAALLATVQLAAGAAHAEPAILGVCQSLVGDQTRCDVDVDWTVEKSAAQTYMLDPAGEEIRYTITVTEGETRYALDLATVLSLTGLVPEGTQVRGVTISLQRGDAATGFATVASARIGDLDEDCGCPFVDNGALDIEIRDALGQLIDLGADSVVEHLGYGERVDLLLRGSYDLGSGVIVPGDGVRVQTCVRYASVDELDMPGCAYDGGAIRTARACNPFDFAEWANAEPAQVAVTDTLLAFPAAFVDVTGVTARATAGQVAPSGALGLSPGGSGAVFAVTATGVAGATSTIAVTGAATCAEEVDCAAPVDGICEATLTNTVALSSGPTADAGVTLACSLQRCPAGGCNDGDPCTDDLCSPSLGCVHAPATGPACSDSDACTSGDACVAGHCLGAAITCPDDGDPCTVTWCDPAGGCQTGPAPDHTACDDGDACTSGDVCGAGVCGGGRALGCDDDNPCTVDSCDPALGCVFTPREGPCDDGDACSAGDQCVAGQCLPGPPLECASGSPCRGTYCDPSAGCVETPTEDGSWCDDGDHCTGCPWPEMGVKRGFMATHADVIQDVRLPGGYVLWMAGFYGGRAQVRMRGLDDLRFLWFDDGRAALRGTVEVYDTGFGPAATDQRYAIDVEFRYRGMGAAGQGTGGPHRELPVGWQGFEHTDGWHYFEHTGGTLQSLTSGNWAQLDVRPAAGVFPLQLGWQANDRNGNFGASAWFTYTHYREDMPTLSGDGDINVDLTEVFCGENDVCAAGSCQSGETVQACGEIADGDYCTWRPGDFAGPCNHPSDGACRLQAGFEELLHGAPHCAGASTLTIGFTTWTQFAFSMLPKLQQFLGAGATMAPPVGRNLVCNPHAIYSTKLSRELLALKINILMSDRGLSPAPHGYPLGDLVVDAGECMDLTVRQVAHRAEMIFATLDVDFGDHCDSPQILEKAMKEINQSFRKCTPGTGYVVLGAPWVGDGVTKAHQVIVAPMPQP